MRPIYEFCEVAERLRRRKGVNSLDKRALLVILDDRPGEADRWIGHMRRRNELGISVVTSTDP